MIKKHNKLVRDRIPEIIEKAGEKPSIRILTGNCEYLREIKKKISEEAAELIRAKNKKEVINEIIDIQQLIDTLTAELGITRFELWELQRRKNEEKGGFKKRLFLIKTENKP